MNKEILYEALISPSRVGEVPRDELERVAREYPYFNSAQVLLARSYRQTGDHRFSDQLQVASQTSGDRLSLYHLLKEEIQAKRPEIETIQATAPLPIAVPESPIEIPATSITVTPVKESVVVPEKMEGPVYVSPIVIRPSAPVTENTAPEKQITHEIISDIALPPLAANPTPSLPIPSDKTSTDEKPVRDALDEAILARAVSSSIELEVGEEEQSENEEEDNENESEMEGNDESFATWVAKRAKDIGYQEDKPNSTHLPVYNESGQARIQPSTTKKKTQQDLIDRFIQTNPRIQPGKSDEYDLENIARTSITEDLSVVSETMAVLLASQGKKEKARRVYRKLMELHPEKSVYFAAQLKILDKLK
jgi:hypothetical protein